ncbi:hypothetical protein AXG93_4193s1110 [Marchantia polymorpha subsp. ruderalis]|uniref:Nucleolar 27S pre-rRNA processing Urb2/Npa2 C-terminal domain-containing protein n=1 Tax=Marchantia polymorpha subsp. ruderalis TaxID=1480154 RepID=A0A176W520_MARPO|nr:hypothetical protein AXG93_4193s1110 [Marchantia polymorpha subsp. ruderalis]
MQSTKKISRRKRPRDLHESVQNLSEGVSPGGEKNAGDSEGFHTPVRGKRRDGGGAIHNIEVSEKNGVNSNHESHRISAKKQLAESPERKKRKKQNGFEGNSPKQSGIESEKSSAGVSTMQVDHEESNGHCDGGIGSAAVKADVSPTGPISNLALVRMLQNTKISKPSKIEAAYRFIKDEGKMLSTKADRVNARAQIRKADSMPMPQFVSFLFEWAQNAILWSSKPQTISKLSAASAEGGLTTCPPHLDYRYWGILSWCISSGNLPLSASLSPGLLRSLDQYVRNGASVDDTSATDSSTKGTWMNEDSVRSIEVLLFANQRSFRPDLDHWVSLAVTALARLSSWKTVTIAPHHEIILSHRLFVRILEAFSGFIAIHPNRKKTFVSLVDNLLEPLLLAHGLFNLPSHQQPHFLLTGDLILWKNRLLKALEEILEKGLFHPAHTGFFHGVCTFLSGKVDSTSEMKEDLKKGGRPRKGDEDKDMVSYQKLMFRKLDQIRKMRVESALTELGWIFEAYSRSLKIHQAADALDFFGVNTKGKLQNSSSNVNTEKIVEVTEEGTGKVADSSAGGPRSVEKKDQNREARFTVFAELTGPVLTDLQACWSSPEVSFSYEHLSTAQILLRAFNSLLKAAVTEGTYVPTEDSAKHTHFTFLKKCFSVVTDFGNLLPVLLNGSDTDEATFEDGDRQSQGSLVEGNQNRRKLRSSIVSLLREIIVATTHLLEMEYRVAENFLEDVWFILLHGAAFNEPSVKHKTADRESTGTASQAAVRVACQIISTYSDLRQVDRALFTLCGTLRNFIHPPSKLASQDGTSSRYAPRNFGSNLGASGFLVCAQLFLSAVARAMRSLPEGQVAEFIRLLTGDSLESITAIENSMKYMQEGLDGAEDGSTNTALFEMGFVELYSCMLENVNITATNSLLCCKAVSSFMRGVVVTNMSELIDSCLDTENSKQRGASSLDNCRRGMSGKEEKDVEGSLRTWHVILKLRLFMSSRSLHTQCLRLMPPKAVRKANLALGGYFIDYHKLDVENVATSLNAGMFFSAVGRSSVKVSDFLAGLKAKVNDNELVECPALQYCLDCIAIQSLVDLARHVEAVSFLVMKYGEISPILNEERGANRILSEGNEAPSPPKAEDVDFEILRKLQKLHKSMKQESRKLAKTLLQGLPPISGAWQLESSLFATVANWPTENAKDQSRTSTTCPEGNWEQLAWDHVDATLTAESLHVRRWRLLCQTFDVWAKYAADKDLKKFLICLLACSVMTTSAHVASRQGDGGLPRPEVTGMQKIANDLLSNSLFFEEESIRRFFASSFLEALKSSVCSAFGNWPFEWYTSDDSLDKEVLFRVATEWSDLVEAQIGEEDEEKDLEVLLRSKSLTKKRKKWKLDSFELNVDAIRNCVSLVDQLSILPSGYLTSTEASRCAYALQCLERLLVQSILQEQLTALDLQQGRHKTVSGDFSTVFAVLEGLSSCRSALLVLTSSGTVCSNDNVCTLLTVLSGSFALVKWPSQSLHAAATCFVDVVERSKLSDNEKLNKLSLGEELLHVALKRTASLFTYICEENLRLEEGNVHAALSGGALASSDGKEHSSKVAANGDCAVFVKHPNGLYELLRLQATKIDQLVQKRGNVELSSHSATMEAAGGRCLRDFKSCYAGLAIATSLCSYFWTLVSSGEKSVKGSPVLENRVMLLLNSSGNINALGHILMRTLVRALVPDGSHAMLIVGEADVDRNLQSTDSHVDGRLEANSVQAINEGEVNMKDQDEDEEGSDDDDSEIASDSLAPPKEDTRHGIEEEDDDDEEQMDAMQDEVVLKEEEQENVTSALNLAEAEFSKNSSVQRVALSTLLEGSSTEMCNLIGELYLAAAGYLKFEAFRLSRSTDKSKCSGCLPPGGDVLLGAGCWILLKAAERMRSGQCSGFGWLVGVVKYIESVEALLPHVKSFLTPAAFNKLFTIHIYLLGSLSPAENDHRRESQPLDVIDQLELSTPIDMLSDGVTKGEAKGASDFVLREAVRSSLGLLMKTAPRHHSVLALQAITRALVGASEDYKSSSGLELCADETGKVGRGVAAGVQSLSIALESISGTKRLRLLANHFKEFSGAILNLIERLTGPKMFYDNEIVHHDKAPREGQVGMVQSGSMGEHKETLGKYCCHILSDYLSVLSGHDTYAVGLMREVEAALRPGAYVLVDACSANDLQQLHASLGEGPRRNALLALRREYTQQFKYTGKV